MNLAGQQHTSTISTADSWKLTEADGSITSYEYDVMDRITAVTDAEGHKTTFTYDKVGNQLSMTEEEEATYKYAYDKKDRVISQTNPLEHPAPLSMTEMIM